MRPHRRAVLALGGGITLAGALTAPALADPFVELPPSPTASVACVDRVAAATPVADGGLGITSVVALPVPDDQMASPPVVPAPPTNPAVAVVTVDNPGEGLFAALVSRDDEVAVPVIADPHATATAAFEVTDGAMSTFKIADVTGQELAFVVSTSDCTPPLGWCDDVRIPGAPVAAANADICDMDGDGIFTVPGDPAEPVATGHIAGADTEVLAAQVGQTAPPPPPAPPLPYGVIGVPSVEPAAPAPEEEVAPAPAPAPEPQLALSGSRSGALAGFAAVLLGTGAAVLGLGQRRIDVELDVRMAAAMSRIASAAAPQQD